MRTFLFYCAVVGANLACFAMNTISVTSSVNLLGAVIAFLLAEDAWRRRVVQGIAS